MAHHDHISNQFTSLRSEVKHDSREDRAVAYLDGLNEEEREVFSETLTYDPILSSIRIESIMRASEIFTGLPEHGYELASNFTMSLPTNPIHHMWQAEKYPESYDYAFRQSDQDATGAIIENRPLSRVAQALRYMLRSDVMHDSVLDWSDDISGGQRVSLKEERALSIAAKKHVKELFEEKADALGGIDLDAYTGALNEIYLYTLLAGKKALYQQVADKLETIREKNLSKLIESEMPFLKDAVMLGLRQERTPDQQARFEDITRAHPMTAILALRDTQFLHYHTSLRFIARHGNEKELQGKMVAFANTALAGNIETADEKTRMTERLYELVGPGRENQTEETPNAFNFDPMELDWEVLPPGESELEKGARQIVEESSMRTGKAPEIDLSRLNILEGIRELWGKDKSYYSRGVRQKRSVVHTPEGRQQPDEYIILVLQETDSNTGLVRESAVAESPIAGPNALYVYRPEATDHQHSWRTVMSLPKGQSRRLGARNILHTTPQGSVSLNDTMVQKTLHLLTVEPNEFPTIEFKGIDKRGNVRIRRALGQKGCHEIKNRYERCGAEDE